MTYSTTIRNLLAVAAAGVAFAGISALAPESETLPWSTRESKGTVPGPLSERFKRQGAEASPLFKGRKASIRFRPALTPSRAPIGEDLQPMTGLMYRCDAWTAWDTPNQAGFYTLPADGKPASLTKVGDVSTLPWNFFGSMGCVYSPEGIYLNLCDYDGFTLDGYLHYVINPETYEVEKSWKTAECDWVNSGAYDPTSGLVYAQITSPSIHRNGFGRFDVQTGEVSSIQTYEYESLGYQLYIIAFDSKGKLYGITSIFDDEQGFATYYLAEVDKRTGEVSKKATLPLGRDQLAGASAAIDPTDTWMYVAGASYEVNSVLYAIKLSDGTVESVYNIPGNPMFKDIWFPITTAPDVPAPATGLSVAFSDDSLTGKVCFSMPSTTVSGKPHEGPVSYEVTFNGGDLVSGQAMPGAEVEAEATVSQSGWYSVGLRLKNEAGYTPVQSIKTHIGRDVPQAMANPVLTYDKETEMLTLRWETPGPQYGGFYEPEKLTYNIMDWYGREFTGITGNSFTLAEPTDEGHFINYDMFISPVYDGKVFPRIRSNRVIIGKMTYPYTSNFTWSDFGGFTFINANGDWREWSIDKLWEWMTVDGNEQFDTDDWAIFPPAPMEKGKAYRVNVLVSSLMPTKPEVFTLNCGNDTTVMAQEKHLIYGPVSLHHDGKYWHHAYFSPEESGDNYFSIHAITPKQNGRMYVHEVRIDEPIDGRLACEVDDYDVVRSEDGSLTAILTFRAPSCNLIGQPLASISKIEVKRGEELIATLQATPGQEITYKDTTVPENGVYTYTVTPFTANGEGMGAERSAFIGVRVPQGINWVKGKYGIDTGHFNITWDCDAIDTSGEPFDESQLRFNVYTNDPETDEQIKIASEITAKKKVYRACKATDPQRVVFFGVEPLNNAGPGMGMTSEYLMAGKPDEIPFRESFAEKQPHFCYAIDYHPYYYAIWLFADDSDFPGISSVDSDNGFLVFGSSDVNYEATWISGNISLKDAVSPTMSYFYYTWEYANTVEVQVFNGDEWVTVDKFASDEAYAKDNVERWVRRSVDLTPFAGKNMQYRLIGKCIDGMYTLMDNIRIGEPRGTDMDVSQFKVRNRVNGGEPFHITARISNYGDLNQAAYQVKLYEDGEAVEVRDMQNLEAGASVIADFSRTIGFGETSSHIYRVEVVADGDEDLSNNNTALVEVKCITNEYPMPQALIASEKNGVQLSWTAPDLSGNRRITVTDDVEDYPDFSTGLESSALANDNTGEWTMIDGDGAYTYSFSGAKQYPNINARAAFMVFNPEEAGVDTSISEIWRPKSGQRMFASFLPVSEIDEDYNRVPVAKDDWLVSPRLTGDAQTVSFWVRTMSTGYSEERYEVYRSAAEAPSKEGMVIVGEERKAAYGWEQVTVDLPEGTNYFAIRNIGADAFVMLVDDIEFQPASAAGIGMTLKGYNVYRDGKKITSRPVTKTSYSDSFAGNGRHKYHVTAVYGIGESMPAGATLEVTALGEVSEGGIRVYGDCGCIVVLNAGGCDVTLADFSGKVLKSSRATTGNYRLGCAPGAYVVTVGGRAFKAIVE